MNRKIVKKQPPITTEDKLEIHALISTYSFMWDEKNAVGVSELFTDNCVWSWYRLDGTEVLEMTNRKTFHDFVEKMFSNQLNGIQTRHFQTNTIFIELTENTVQAKTVYLSTKVLLNDMVDMENNPLTSYQGVYEDVFVKTKNGWKFKKRKVVTDN